MYLPLQFYSQVKFENLPSRQPIKPYLTQMITDDDMLHTLCVDKNLFTEKIEGPISTFSNEIRNHWKYIYKWAAGEDPKHPVFTVKYKDFVRKNFIHMVIVNKWGRYKKVYKFDPELELTLSDAEKIKIPISLLRNLPYKDFYVQFSEDGIFSDNFHGCYVSFIETDNVVGLYFCRVNHNLQTMGGLMELMKDTDNNILIETDDIDWKKHRSTSSQMDQEIYADWNEFCFFIVNAVLYLCAANAEIELSEPKDMPVRLNKAFARTEREAGKEDHMEYFECGYRYGQTIRLLRDKEQSPKEDVDTTNITTKKRKAPRPHPVKASWQHYWIGHGDKKQRILKFKAPYYQGGFSKYATISKVK